MKKIIIMLLGIVFISLIGYYGYNYYSYLKEKKKINYYKEISDKVNQRKEEREKYLIPPGNLTEKDLYKRTYAKQENIDLINNILLKSSFYKSIRIENNEKYIIMKDGKYFLKDLVYNFRVKGNKSLENIFNYILQNGKGNGFFIHKGLKKEYLIDIDFKIIGVKIDGKIVKDDSSIGKSILDLY